MTHEYICTGGTLRNREKIAAQQKEYYEANREKIAAQKKEYREANREKIAAQQKEAIA